MSDKDPASDARNWSSDPMETIVYERTRADKAEAELAPLRVERNQLADKLTLCMLDRKRERDHVHLLQGEIRQLSAAMWDAIECVEVWSAYASEYFKEKHDLAGDLARLRAAMKGKPGK